MRSGSGKGFTLIELTVVIAIIGILALLATNINLNKKSDIEKLDRLNTKISNIINSTKLNMSSWRWVLYGTSIINPSQTEILFYSGGIVTRYYSNNTSVGTGETFVAPFYGENKYTLIPLYSTDKSLSSTGTFGYPTSIVFDNQGNISFSGDTLSEAVLLDFQINYGTASKIFEFDRRGFGRITTKKL